MRSFAILIGTCLGLATPCLATTMTTLTGTVAPNGVLELDIPILVTNASLRFLFEFDGGTPDGGSVLFHGRGVLLEIDEFGQVYHRDRDDILGCDLAFGTRPAQCTNQDFGYSSGNSVAGRVTSSSVELTFRVAPSFDNCATQQTIGVCAEYSSVGGDFLTAYFIGDVPTNYRIVYGFIPEPATWALMIGGFGMTGATMRLRRTALAA